MAENCPRTLVRAERVFNYTVHNKCRRPFYEDLVSIFGALITSIPLEGHSVGLFSPMFHFSFTAKEAVSSLASLKVQQIVRSVDKSGKAVSSTTITTYEVGAKGSEDLMRNFLEARLIKCLTTSDSMAYKFKKKMLFQLTAKGLTVVELFCQRSGVSLSPKLIQLGTKSGHKNPRLILLERDQTTDLISVSESLIEILFRRFMGPRPNTESSTFAYGSSNGMACVREQDEIKGVKVHESRRILLREYKNCFSGADALVWMMENTSAVNQGEAEELLHAILRQQLIAPIDRQRKCFVVDKNTYYQMTEIGWHQSQWATNQVDLSPSVSTKSEGRERSPVRRETTPVNDQRQAMDRILTNPALKMLFREHLAKNYCEENLNFYQESGKVISQFEELERTGFQSRAKVNACISEAWIVYNGYLAEGAVSEVNIDHGLRQRVRDGMTGTAGTGETGEDEGDMKLKSSGDSIPGADETGMAKSLESRVRNLRHIMELLSDVRMQVYRLMASDSVPKFLRSEDYQY
ncbi:uncharacterized protein V1516DRAFT_621729 [Lipomyces oligophaga]|uniref:uncharacterized protein n=1 Tax=Lipomyces oligophaga TaxID=45792 RepID=UPI0034CDDBFD